ncbi:hypothetical protein HDU67_001314 [Dinochytrium kinnereticum]|nr:hypothetical protein HDU67_001314 [Dinochytrium kinnereticum]
MSIPRPPTDLVIPADGDGQEVCADQRDPLHSLSTPMSKAIHSQAMIPYPFSDNEDSADDVRLSSYGQGGESDAREASPDTATGHDVNESDEDMDMNHPSEGLNTLKVEKVLHSGYLMKKGEKRKTWKKRWFVLRATIFAYYKNEKEYELLKIIPLAEVHTIAEVKDLKKRKNVFGVVTRQRTYYIMSDNKEQMDEWLVKLKEAHREVQRLLKKDHTPSQRSSNALNLALPSGSPARAGPMSAPPMMIGTSLSFSNGALSFDPNLSGGLGSPKLEPRVRFIDSDIVEPSTSRQNSVQFTGDAPPDAAGPQEGGNASTLLPSLEPTMSSPLESTLTSGEPALPAPDVSDTQSQASNLSSAFTVESMLTVISTPSIIQAAQAFQTPITPLPTTPSAPVASDSAPPPLSVADQAGPSYASQSNENLAGVGPTMQRPSQSSIVSSRPITGILVNRNPSINPSSPLAQSASSQRPSYRREAVLSSSDEEDDGGNESDGTINDNKVVCEGYLYKQGTKYKQEYVVKRLVPLRNVLDVHEVDPQGRHQHCFKVVLSKRTMILSADSDDELNRWISTLRNVHRAVMRREAQEDTEE